jgi:hypothetical protein
LADFITIIAESNFQYRQWWNRRIGCQCTTGSPRAVQPKLHIATARLSAEVLRDKRPKIAAVGGQLAAYLHLVEPQPRLTAGLFFRQISGLSVVTLPSLMRVGFRWRGLLGNPVRHPQNLLGSPSSARRFHRIPALKSAGNSGSKNDRPACRLNRQPTQTPLSLARYDESCTAPVAMILRVATDDRA